MTATPQWTPTEADVAGARVTDFARFVRQRTGREHGDYQSLWQWSTDDLDEFWAALWDYFELGDRPDKVLASAEMPAAQWFPGVQLNYVDEVIRNARSDRPAILYLREGGDVVQAQRAAVEQDLRHGHAGCPRRHRS